MTQRTLAVLIVINAMLLAGLALLWHDHAQPSTAQAQAFGGGAQFTMIAGDTRTRSEQVIYVINLQNGTVSAFQFTGGNRKFNPIDQRNLGDDLQRLQGGNR